MSSIFSVFSSKFTLRHIGQSIGWAKSMSFASIDPFYPRTNSWNFLEKTLGVSNFGKKNLLHPHEKVSWVARMVEILMITLVSSQKSPTPNIFGPSVTASCHSSLYIGLIQFVAFLPPWLECTQSHYIYISRSGQFLWNRNWDLGWFGADWQCWKTNWGQLWATFEVGFFMV